MIGGEDFEVQSAIVGEHGCGVARRYCFGCCWNKTHHQMVCGDCKRLSPPGTATLEHGLIRIGEPRKKNHHPLPHSPMLFMRGGICVCVRCIDGSL